MSAENPPSPLLTVAMPVYNGGDQLRMAMLSVIDQSFTDWELLLIDDGSSDYAVENLADIADQRVRIIRDGHNRGLAARLNQAIDLARGEYFARMDQDDICHPNRFERQLAALSEDVSLDLCAARCVTISENNQITGALPFREQHAEICSKPWLGFYMPHPSWMGRTTWFRKHRYATPGPYCCEDQEMLLRTHTQSHFRVLPVFLLAYRMRDSPCFDKAWRTRMTLFRVQCRYFLSRNDIGNAVLAGWGLCGRVIKDLVSMFVKRCGLNRRFSIGQGLSVENLVDWKKLLGDLSERQDRKQTILKGSAS